jgi:hypothetical protein
MGCRRSLAWEQYHYYRKSRICWMKHFCWWSLAYIQDHLLLENLIWLNWLCLSDAYSFCEYERLETQYTSGKNTKSSISICADLLLLILLIIFSFFWSSHVDKSHLPIIIQTLVFMPIMSWSPRAEPRFHLEPWAAQVWSGQPVHSVNNH